MDYNFKDLKRKVGIEEVAYALGYRVNKAAGVGKYIEMVLPGSDGKADTIVINNSVPKEQQLYFHRTTSQKGDVIELIKENINSFNVSPGQNLYDTVGRILSKFANVPVAEKEAYQSKPATENAAFNPDRFEIVPATQCVPRLMTIFTPRGIVRSTVETFAPHLVKILDKEAQYKYENLGFPYRQPGKDEIVGAEWRGQFGKKGKAAGTNSSTAAWIADFSSPNGSMPMNAKNVFFSESGLDAMAFYQMNKAQIDLQSSVFVSLGGSFSDKQIKGIMNRYSMAKAWDCFDNDLPGRIYAVRLAAIASGKALSYSITDGQASVNFGMDGKAFAMDADSVSIESLRKYVKLERPIGSWKAPARFKDWNDCVMDVPMTESKAMKNRFQMMANLRANRMGNHKI